MCASSEWCFVVFENMASMCGGRQRYLISVVELSMGAVQRKQREVVSDLWWCCWCIKIFASTSYSALPPATLLACSKR